MKVAQSCSTLCNPMDCSLPGSSVCGILQARILEWVAIPFSRASSQPRDQTQLSCIAGGFFKNCNKKPPPPNLWHIFFILKVKPGSHQAIIQMLAGLCSLWGSRREPRPCFFQLLEVVWISATWPYSSIFKVSTFGPNLSQVAIDLALPLLCPFPCFKDLCDYIGPTHIIQDNLFILKSSGFLRWFIENFNPFLSLPCNPTQE